VEAVGDVVVEVRDLKEQAMLARDLENYPEAIEILEQAERLLVEEMKQLEQNRTGGELPGDYEFSVRKQLYAIRGSKGGIYRRAGDYLASARAYDAGYEVERDFEDSYNLTQRLVSRVLERPMAAVSDDVVVEQIAVREELNRAERKVKVQVEGPREKDEYAAADLLTLSALLGSSDWRSALQRFLRLAPKSSYARQVTREVLAQVARQAKVSNQPAPMLAERLEEVLDAI
jgi:tetratricopeptide (TPR) repeat protein